MAQKNPAKTKKHLFLKPKVLDEYKPKIELKMFKFNTPMYFAGVNYERY